MPIIPRGTTPFPTARKSRATREVAVPHDKRPLAIEDAPAKKRQASDALAVPKARQRRPPVLPQSVLDRLSITPVGQQILSRMSGPSVPIPTAERVIRAAFTGPTPKSSATPYAAPKRRGRGPPLVVD